MIDERNMAVAQESLCFTPCYVYGCNICAEQCGNHGSRSPAMGVSTYSTIHNVGLMKLMGQNTVSILKGTKHLTRLLGLVRPQSPIRLILWICVCIQQCRSIEYTFRALLPSLNLHALCPGVPKFSI